MEGDREGERERNTIGSSHNEVIGARWRHLSLRPASRAFADRATDNTTSTGRPYLEAVDVRPWRWQSDCIDLD
ncbi:hypothetical protein J6590_078403 [Homalodisca vitripennis]|nr:hypothetical protein J6590_078403 [Homalodisca vitripennis]